MLRAARRRPLPIPQRGRASVPASKASVPAYSRPRLRRTRPTSIWIGALGEGFYFFLAVICLWSRPTARARKGTAARKGSAR
uniref:Uncharacterized protein n=1 Tax=Arundo donax TaxID=35708 RepID=A0A0A8Y575_ARUDO